MSGGIFQQAPGHQSADHQRVQPVAALLRLKAHAGTFVRVLVPLLVIALAALTPAGCASSSRLAPAACTPADLRVTAAYTQGATQHAIYGLPFANVSCTACKLQGYPGVSLVTAGNSGGRQIGSSRPLIMQSPGPVRR